MDIAVSRVQGMQGFRFSALREGKEVGRAFLYVLPNDLHQEPFGFIEDVFVDEAFRGEGIGSELVRRVLAEAKKQRCYKVICTSRHGKDKVHKLYTELGFRNHGIEFRMDAEK